MATLVCHKRSKGCRGKSSNFTSFVRNLSLEIFWRQWHIAQSRIDTFSSINELGLDDGRFKKPIYRIHLLPFIQRNQSWHPASITALCSTIHTAQIHLWVNWDKIVIISVHIVVVIFFGWCVEFVECFASLKLRKHCPRTCASQQRDQRNVRNTARRKCHFLHFCERYRLDEGQGSCF